MSLHLVTGYAGEAHVTAAEVASFNRATISESNKVFSKGNAFRAQMIDANTVRIYDGDMLLQGRHVILPEREYQDLTIDNGEVGRYRKDLVVVEYSRDTTEGTETAILKVVKGTAVSTQAQAQIPSYTDANIDVEYMTQFPLWVIPINEIAVGTPEKQFVAVQSTDNAIYPPGVTIPDGANLFDLIYPVGSIYMSVSNVNPGTLFGGTWTAWGSGRVPVGVNASDSNFNTVEKTGGSNTVTLTVNQIPSHTHTYQAKIPNYLTAGVGTGARESFMMESNYETYETNARGGGQAHNNLQPYITCYMWKRTA